MIAAEGDLLSPSARFMPTKILPNLPGVSITALSQLPYSLQPLWRLSIHPELPSGPPQGAPFSFIHVPSHPYTFFVETLRSASFAQDPLLSDQPKKRGGWTYEHSPHPD